MLRAWAPPRRADSIKVVGLVCWPAPGWEAFVALAWKATHTWEDVPLAHTTIDVGQEPR